MATVGEWRNLKSENDDYADPETKEKTDKKAKNGVPAGYMKSCSCLDNHISDFPLVRKPIDCLFTFVERVHRDLLLPTL
jgi:hypothetical protein